MTPFCERHTISFLNESEGPLDLALSRYFRNHKSLGATDRRMMGEAIYGMTRWKGLLDWLCPSSSHAERLFCYRTLDFDKIRTRGDIPIETRLGITPYLYDRFCAQFGEKETEKLCKILNGSAPVTIRVNTLKTTRDALFSKWEKTFSITKSASLNAITFDKREPLFSLPEFKEGLFEMQDEGSQKVAAMIDARPGDLVLDYCSGSGGKSLAFAPSMEGKGQIYLHDVRPHALAEAKKRLRRAGIQNAQCLETQHNQMSRLIGKCDWVLADVPCSGSGTLRRNPDQKWKIDLPSVQRLVELQKQIVQEASRFVKPGGFLVYATCSLLREENEAQVAFISQLPGFQLEGTPLTVLPEEKGPDGFFAAKFVKS